MHRSLSRHAAPMLLLLLAASTAACEPSSVAASPGAEASAPTDTNASPAPAASASPVERVRLPSGFPVLPGARSEGVPDDDPAAIARWTSDEVGPVAYDFYVEALPASGYPTTGLFPGGAVAVIRFEGPRGTTWQLVLTRGGDGTLIEVRLDQP